ncbi:hypothetical protein I4U23_003549 [Adineta vaga]|nr:hypothetical protein I4U23_003549 [Adineta vaga]
MNLFLILIGSVLFTNIVHSRPYLTTDDGDVALNDLKYLIRKRTIAGTTTTHKASCIVVAEFLMDLFNDPDLNLSSKQIHLIPTLGTKNFHRRGFLNDDCPPEYQKWFMDLVPFEELLSVNQLETLKSKLWFAE